MKHKAVILGCNYYIGLSAIRCLGSEGIHTVAVDYESDERYGTKSKYCNEILTAPHYLHETEKFVEFLIDYAKIQEVKPVLFPCHDAYVEVLDQYQHVLKEYYLLPTIKQGLLKKLMDKDTLYQIAEKFNVKYPETVYIEHDMSTNSIIEQVEKTMTYPCIIKPVNSPLFVEVFRSKVFIVNDQNDLEHYINLTKEHHLDVFVQRIIPGFDDHMHTFNAYLNEEGQVSHWTTCQKQRQFPINFGASVYTIQKFIPELESIGKHFLESIKYKGIVEIEFKKDAHTGEFYLIELNVRVTNFNQMLADIGLNLPYIQYCELTGQPVDKYAITHTTNRAFMYGLEDLLAIKGYLQTKQLKLSTIIKSFFRPKTYAILNISDMKPFFAFNKSLGKKAIKKVTRRRK